MTNSINLRLCLGIRTSLAALLLCLPFCLQETVKAQQPEQQQSDSALEDLNYATIRVPAAEDFLRRLPAGDLQESSFQTLHEIFTLEDDAFLIDQPAGRWIGLRQTSMEKLRAAGFSAQQAWNRTAIASAETAWNEAVSRGDVAAAAQIAAGWPLSEYDLRLTLLQSLEAWHAGESVAAAAAISRTLDRCRGTALESRAVSLLRSLEKRLQTLATEATAPVATESVSTISAPWPRPVWRWRELVRQQDSERQQAESTLLLSMDPDTAARMRSFELWKPLQWGPWIIIRAPSRLVALDRRTGVESWWLDTDQALRDPSAPHHEDDSGEVIWQPSRGNRSGIIDAKLDTRWGVLAADDECLWMVDRLPVFNGLDPQSGPFARGRLNPWLPDELQPDTGNVGSRLVCLRRRSDRGSDAMTVDLPPEIAWVSGQGVWEYSVKTPTTVDQKPRSELQPGDSQSLPSRDAQPLVERGNEASPLQLFASGPAVSGDRLIILSESPQNEQLEVLCLNRLTGQTIWRQPLLQLGVLHTLREAAGGVCQSVCFVCGDTAICSLEGSILAAVDLWNGDCRWMLPLARIQSADAGAFPMMFEDGQITAGVPTRCPFLPLSDEKIVICTAPNSVELQAIEAQTGKVVWKVPRIVSGSSGPGGSPDLLAAGLFENQVILVGERHCRSLDLASGDPLWIVETGLCSGSPLCSRDRIVLPQLDGRPLVVDLNRGRLVEQSEMFLPSNASQILGSVTGDEQYLFSGTAGAITAWPRADLVVAADVEAAVGPGNHAFSSTEQLQALLLNGDLDAAEALRSRLNLSTELLSEAWLLERGHQLENAPPNVVAAATSPPAKALLTPSQQLRLQLMDAAAVGRPATSIQSSDRRLQQLSSAWSVSLSAFQPMTLPQPLDATALQLLSLADLRRLAESACLHPAETASPQMLDLLIQELSRRGLSEAAELVAAAWWLEATAGSENYSGAEQAALRLNEIRGLARNIETGFTEGLQSGSSVPLSATAQLQLRSPDTAADDPEGEDLPHAAPWWLPRDIRLAVASDAGRRLLVLDRAGAGLLEQFPNDAGWRAPSITFRQSSRQLSVPALIPVLNESQLHLAALRADGRIRILWSRELPGAALAMPEPQTGPLWPGGLIVHSGDYLFCLHPLTGHPLWKRRLPQEFDYNGLLPSRLFGDQQAVIVLGSDGASIESYRASNGRPLRRTPVQIGRGTECGTVGRFLIYTDLAYRLHVLDGATGEDRLQSEPPIILAATHTESLFAALPRDRILTITAEGELVLVDLQAGRQVFRTKLPPSETMAAVSGIQAFEIGGRLLVQVENTVGAAAGGFGAALNLPFRQQPGMGMLGLGAIGVELRRPPRGAALEIDDGLLCCLDAVTGQLLWVQSRYDCRVQRVAGDPTDLVVLTETRYGRSEDPDGGLAQHVNLEVLHAQTGDVLLQAGRIAMSGIHASWHDARAAEIRLMGTDGVVVIRRAK